MKENIFGSDILEYNIRRAKLILTLYALQNSEQLEDCDFNLYHQDSLRANWKMSFDNIVGNPPYVKFRDITVDNRNYLSEHWATVANEKRDFSLVTNLGRDKFPRRVFRGDTNHGVSGEQLPAEQRRNLPQILKFRKF